MNPPHPSDETRGWIPLAVATTLIITSAVIYFYLQQKVRCGISQPLNNMRQIYLATFQMETDGTVGGNAELGWPGDLAMRPNGIRTVSDLLRRLIKYDYLRETDVKKMTEGPGITGWSLAQPDASKNCAFKVYRITEKDGLNAIAFASRNFTYGRDLDPNQLPYGDKGFVIIRKGGDGMAFKKQQARDLEIIGLLPGRKDFNDRPVETAEDTLEQR